MALRVRLQSAGKVLVTQEAYLWAELKAKDVQVRLVSSCLKRDSTPDLAAKFG